MSVRRVRRTVLHGLAGAALAVVLGASNVTAQDRSVTVTGVSSFKLVEPLIPDFVKETGIKVDLQILPYPQVRQRSLADFVSGTANSDVYGQDIIWLGEWAKNGYVRPLDDLIARDIKGEDAADILPGAFDALSKWDGKTWSMPFGAYYFLNFYRADLFDQAGLKAPVTLADVDAAAGTLTNKSKNLFGIAMVYQRGGPIASWFLATYTGAGGRLLKDPPADFTPTLDSPEALDGPETLYRLAQGRAERDDRLSLERPDGRDAVGPAGDGADLLDQRDGVRQARNVLDLRQGRLHHHAPARRRGRPRDPVRRLGARDQQQDAEGRG